MSGSMGGSQDVAYPTTVGGLMRLEDSCGIFLTVLHLSRLSVPVKIPSKHALKKRRMDMRLTSSKKQQFT
jgi:hypothetical protein